MGSPTDIVNLALTHLGQTTLVENVETGTDFLSKRLRKMYDMALRTTQSESDWSWNRKQVVLALLREDPDIEFTYAYALPDKCIRPRRILNTVGVPERSILDIIQFRIMSGTGQKELWTCQAEAKLEYSELVTDTNLFPPEYEEALSYRIASYGAPAFMQGDRRRREEVILELFRMSIAKAKAADAQGEQDQVTPISDSIRSRG